MRKPRVVTLLVLLLANIASSAEPEVPEFPTWEKALKNDYYEISLDLRMRLELADQDGADRSRANTFRTLLGLRTKPTHGLSGFVQLENNTAINNDRYWGLVHASNGKTGIADPRHTSVNQAYGRYQNRELWGLDVRGGRQMIVLDDARFIGNVGWRQNMQTFDSARAGTNLGVHGLQATFAYLWEVLRIFGDQGPADRKDFDSDSALVHVSYDKLGWVDASAFAYLLDFDNSPGNSSNSYGFRAIGKYEINQEWSVLWVASYAYQTDAADNTVSYHAHYVNTEAGVGLKDRGTFKIGYELLGSDAGKARFVTPLVTAHKFNGYADAFLDNGGPNGLRDLYFTLSPELPLQLNGHVTYHRFWSDEHSDDLGQEWDVVISRPITSYLTGLAKAAYYNGKSPGPADRWRLWLDFTFTY